jgi:mannose-6-phosphate isomerase-like protein (cupin superfamily)
VVLRDGSSARKFLPVVLPGGVSSCLWPLSRKAHPKPFIKLGNRQSLLQKSYIRAWNISNLDKIVTGTNRGLFFQSKNKFEGIRVSASKNTFYNEIPARHRFWGTYTVLQDNVGFEFKQIEVKPSYRLSLQSHKHRSGRWVVVSGKALVTDGAELIKLTFGQSTFIALGNKHSLKNLGTEQLILIEFECGCYLGKDDIVGYENSYGRTE